MKLVGKQDNKQVVALITGHDQTKIKSNQTKLNNIRPNKTKSNQIQLKKTKEKQTVTKEKSK